VCPEGEGKRFRCSSGARFDRIGEEAVRVVGTRLRLRSLGAPGRTRTCDPLLRRQPLCPLSYRRSLTCGNVLRPGCRPQLITPQEPLPARRGASMPSGGSEGLIDASVSHLEALAASFGIPNWCTGHVSPADSRMKLRITARDSSGLSRKTPWPASGKTSSSDPGIAAASSS
jgi:hypothetical protein